MDEFYSENLAQEVVRGMREAASRGFWVASRVPYGYRKLMVQDGAKKRPTLEPDPATAPVVKRIFGMAESGRGILDITRTLNDEGIANPTGRLWSKNGVHIILRNETYTGTLVWGIDAKDKAEPVRVEKAFPAIISKVPVPPGEPEAALPRSQAEPPPQGGKLLPSQRASQVQGVQPRSLRPGRQEREVRLLRLPVGDEARQRGLRRPAGSTPGASRRRWWGRFGRTCSPSPTSASS